MAENKKLILLTNDDGITAPGLVAMYRHLTDMAQVQVVAPETVAECDGAWDNAQPAAFDEQGGCGERVQRNSGGRESGGLRKTGDQSAHAAPAGLGDQRDQFRGECRDQRDLFGHGGGGD